MSTMTETTIQVYMVFIKASPEESGCDHEAGIHEPVSPRL